MNNKYISWRRVSTFKQNRTGLGLAAQKEIIRYFIERDGGEWIADYEECYTGKELSGCVELHKAMEHAKKEGAILIIAKSDRFRNTAEALKIYEEMGDGNIMFCDLPATDKFTLTLFWALAEREALITSIRTKQALAVKKAQGCKLGAASEKYKETYNKKTFDELKEITMKRGETKNRRRMEDRDTVAMLRILRNVFPSATENEDPKEWDWGCVTTRGDYKERIYALMQDYRELDHDLFRRWDFEIEKNKLQVKLAAYLQSLKKSVMY